MTPQGIPAMPDTGRLVTASIRTAQRSAGLNRRQAALAVESVALQLCRLLPPDSNGMYAWCFDLLSEASSRTLRTKP